MGGGDAPSVGGGDARSGYELHAMQPSAAPNSLIANVFTDSFLFSGDGARRSAPLIVPERRRRAPAAAAGAQKAKRSLYRSVHAARAGVGPAAGARNGKERGSAI